MIALQNLPISIGRKNSKKRRGRGAGSTLGKTSGRGQKGQYARNTVALGFEGGQTPLRRRIPRRGFKNFNKTEYTVLNLLRVMDHPALKNKDTVTIADLRENGLVRTLHHPIKVLGLGEVDRKISLEAHFFSQAALDKIKSSGGEAIVMSIHPA